MCVSSVNSRAGFSADADADPPQGPHQTDPRGAHRGRGAERRQQGVRLYQVNFPRGGQRLEASISLYPTSTFALRCSIPTTWQSTTTRSGRTFFLRKLLNQLPAAVFP